MLTWYQTPCHTLSFHSVHHDRLVMWTPAELYQLKASQTLHQYKFTFLRGKNKWLVAAVMRRKPFDSTVSHSSALKDRKSVTLSQTKPPRVDRRCGAVPPQSTPPWLYMKAHLIGKALIRALYYFFPPYTTTTSPRMPSPENLKLVISQMKQKLLPQIYTSFVRAPAKLSLSLSKCRKSYRYWDANLRLTST